MATTYLNLRSSAETDPIRNFRFLVNFIPLTAGGLGQVGTGVQSGKMSIGFMAIQGLAAQTEPIPYREGGFNTTVHYLPGQQTFPPVTFSRGVVLGGNIGWEWFRSLYDPGVAAETITGDFRYQIEIKVLKHPSAHNRNMNQNDSSLIASDTQVAATFTLMNAWPTTLSYSDLNAADNAVMIEQLVCVHEGFVPNINPAGQNIVEANGNIRR